MTDKPPKLHAAARRRGLVLAARHNNARQRESGSLFLSFPFSLELQDLAVLLNREAFRLSGLLPFELVPAAVRGAVAGAIVSKWTSVTSSRESPPQSILGESKRTRASPSVSLCSTSWGCPGFLLLESVVDDLSEVEFFLRMTEFCPGFCLQHAESVPRLSAPQSLFLAEKPMCLPFVLEVKEGRGGSLFARRTVSCLYSAWRASYRSVVWLGGERHGQKRGPTSLASLLCTGVFHNALVKMEGGGGAVPGATSSIGWGRSSVPRRPGCAEIRERGVLRVEDSRRAYSMVSPVCGAALVHPDR